MVKPISAKKVFKEIPKNISKVDDSVIIKINGFLKNEKFSFNDGLDEVFLTRAEFNYIKKIYEKEGWSVTSKPDNYQTTSYIFSPKLY